MPDEVLAWLNGGRNYTAGVELLRKYGASKFLIDLLSSGPDAFNTPKLLKEMQKIEIQEPGAGRQDEKEVVPSAAISTSKKPYTPDHNLEKKLRIQKIIKDLLKEITHLRGRLVVLPEGDELYECAKLVLTRDLKKRDLWDQLHYFENNGVWFDELPENQVKDFDPADKQQLEQKIKNLMASRSKVSKLLKKPWPVGVKAHHEKRKAEFDRQIEHFKSLR